ncbi:hypothetical protein FEM03_08205 [Phragmitibacter flavus]|uniref:RiboL-PSP-HEPN domain-containing protein n=1 Tax=Phragmitibacter flavus TaxID=2576071 RepID=A0A5R8KGR7_9BACT|nr:hypothetical protein [Phragmitibacter flavus]TLD71496.1 hypothetical protein FEM03_08205 [Phragmitibacter flavus]
MRTLSPTSIRDDFLAALVDVETTFQAAESAGINAAGMKLITEFSFLSAAILFEGYISDLFVAYINRDSSVFSAHLVGKMVIETIDPHAKRAKSLATISIHQRLTAADIRSVLDSRDYNITFPTVAEMKTGAGQWLAPSFKAYFVNLTASHAAILSATKTMRNFLAHRSGASKNEMQTALAASDLPASLRRGQHTIRDVGSFLRSRPTPQESLRFNQYLQALNQIGNALCP